MRRLTMTVLVLECVVIALAVPVAAQVGQTDIVLALGGAGVLVASAVVIVASLRFRWAYVATGVWHALVIATGVVVPVMYFLGSLFAALWATALWLGRQHEANA